MTNKDVYYGSGPVTAYIDELPPLFPTFGFKLVMDWSLFDPRRRTVLRGTTIGSCVDVTKNKKRRRIGKRF